MIAERDLTARPRKAELCDEPFNCQPSILDLGPIDRAFARLAIFLGCRVARWCERISCGITTTNDAANYRRVSRAQASNSVALRVQFAP